MGDKCFQAKIICDSPSHREHLDVTHRLFNEHLVPVVSILYAARRGDHGDEYRAILSRVRGAQRATAQVEAITSLKARPGTGGTGDWKEIARSLLQKKRILFDREQWLPGFSSEFRRKVFETAFQIILGHEAKMSAWREEHEEWLDGRQHGKQTTPNTCKSAPSSRSSAGPKARSASVGDGGTDG